MSDCNILYTSDNKGKLASNIKKISNNKISKEDFKSSFITGSIPKETRISVEKTDNLSNLEKSIIEFYNDFDDIVNTLKTSNPDKSIILDELKEYIITELHIEADNTQSVSILEDNEIKTQGEILDKNKNNLNKHLDEIYGVGSVGIKNLVKSTFADLIYSAAYCDRKTGEIINMRDDILNKNISRLKEQLLEIIKNYLIKENINYEEDIYNIQKILYNHIKQKSNLDQELNNLYFDRLNKEDEKQKFKLFEELCNQLEENKDLKKQLKFFLKKYNLTSYQKELYNGDEYSSSYLAIKECLIDLDHPLKSYINDIESINSNLFEATNAYTILVYFDELLIDTLGKQISIKNGTKNLNVEDKYFYHQDTQHEIKGWQTSEDISSEKHTSFFTKSLLNQIPVFDHKTGQFKNKRTDITSYIFAMRHFMNDVLYNNIYGTDANKYNLIKDSVIKFHKFPKKYLQQILELLFEENGYETLSNKTQVTNQDLDILYSVYLKIFDKKNKNSYFNQELQGIKNNLLVPSLTQEIAMATDCNIIADYLESHIDLATKKPILKIKKKFNNNQQLKKLFNVLNAECNIKSINDRKELQKKYQFKSYSDKNDTKYVVYINGDKLELIINNKDSLLKGDSLENNFNFKFNDIAIKKFKDKDKEHEILTFIDDFLKLNINSNQGKETFEIYKANLPKDKLPQALYPLVKLAIKAAYINKQYIDAFENNKTLLNYLSDKKDSFYLEYDTIKKQNKKSKNFSEHYGDLKYILASYDDKVLEKWIDAKSIFSGENLKSTTKDGNGNNMPNNSVSKLGGISHYYLDKQKNTNCEDLLFVNNPELIKSTLHDLEAYNIENKSIKNLSCGEYFYHAIFNKFWTSYINTGNVIVQPTVYSDKTTFLNWEINVKDFIGKNYIDEVLNTYKFTIGNFYSKIYNSTMKKLNLIKDKYNNENNTSLSLKEVLKQLNHEQLLEYRRKVNQDLKLIGEPLIDLELDKDYRVREKIVSIENEDGTITENKIEYCSINEILEYNQKLYNNRLLLINHLKKEKRNFLQNLIDYNCSYQVFINTNSQDFIDDKNRIKTPIEHIIRKIYNKEELKNYVNEWVNEKTGQLILSKPIDDTDFELNPLLNKFFYIEGLLSNNLRLSLTASEINHPDKAYETLFNSVKNIENLKQFNDISKLKLTSDEFNVVRKILNKADHVGDLIEEKNEAIKYIYEESITQIINTAQGTQFKRNVIISATLQYCQQNLYNGIKPKIKCAVIYDKQAAVNNYRGETKKIDSCDGSARISPFQSIMENLSLGSQAVGFIKKPIWHSYDSENGTAFLAKFATVTITNESMKASQYSKSSDYKLFKQMTNLPWEEPIDLTKPIYSQNNFSEDPDKIGDYNNWFEQTILENSKLFYENQFGKKVQITHFNKTTHDGKIYYYTKEKINGVEKFVYHMFDEKSNHYTFDNVKDASQFNGHTIKSLFELHTSLGGIYCVDSEGKSSEFNNKVVVNFMNNIGDKKDGTTNKDDINQETYYQPLKNYEIGYVLNNTAVKNGAKNINPEEAWDGDLKLDYFEVDSDGLGMQMNADHDIVNSELTEFSQVIAATSAYGYTYDYCNQIFQGLAKTAVEASKKLLETSDTFLKDASPDAWSNLYDSVTRIILTKDNIRSKENLEKIISEAVLKAFNKNKNHNDDEIKMPFSDSNIYSQFIANLASNITNASIKRKHPGSGCVMVPAYDIITYFEIGSHKYSYQDILKKSREDYKSYLIDLAKLSEDYNSEKNQLNGTNVLYLTLEDLLKYDDNEERKNKLQDTKDVVNFNTILINNYLNKLQKEEQVYHDKTYFQPEDVVVILQPKKSENGDIIVDEQNNIQYNETRMVLDSMKKYYDFKNHDYPAGTLFQVDIKTPRNLKPSLIRWRYNPISSLKELHIIRSEVYDKPWKNDSTKSNKAFTLSLEEDPSCKFEIVKDHEEGYWSIHFKTIPDGNTFENFIPLTEEQKIRLFKAAADAIPVGDKLSTWGELTPGGVSGINRFKSLGFKQVETREVTDRLGNPIQIPVYEKTGIYMNIFDHPVIKETFEKGGKLDLNYRKKVQEVLNKLHEGIFEMNGKSYNIIPGSLENTEAELIMSNIYKDIFGVENESLEEILEKGEQFFIDQIKNTIHAPKNTLYDIALLKDSGKHTLIRLGNVYPNKNCDENPFTQISVNEKNEIYCMKGNKTLFKIGKYISLSDEEKEDLIIQEKTIISRSGKNIKQDQYRINDNGEIEKRIDFIKRYKLTTKSEKNGKTFYTSNTLYSIVNYNVLKQFYGNANDAMNQIGSFITDIYFQDKYKFIELNPLKNKEFQKAPETISAFFDWFKNNYYVNNDHKNYIQNQLDNIKNKNYDYNKLNKLKEEFYKKEAHRKWVSFQDSVKFISSRIPAQTLQSFMAMKCIGWTENTKNIAYVSHFQTYLQGSDYDIDKAYIMGQSYDENGIYIGWSPLFDYTNIQTLTLSKQLPIPQNFHLEEDDIKGVDITDELNIILNNTDDSINPMSNENRLTVLDSYIKILKKLEENLGSYKHNLEENDKIKKIIGIIYKHNKYQVPENIAEASYKNVASSNIYNVSHDIRNRDQAYTAITMKTLSQAANKSPKGKQTAILNMSNPLTKYIMQYQNLVGKNVISIAANGEKLWFNLYYYWTKCLKENDTKYLKYNLKLDRIKGRFIGNIESITKNHIPDLNKYDKQIKETLLSEFSVDVESEDYVYVDQLISQLLSAATDNAKELILAKINAGSNYARMYLYLIIQGFDINDICSFMTCPIAEFIDSESNPNMYQDLNENAGTWIGMNLAQGVVSSNYFLHGNIYEYNPETDDTQFIPKQKYVLDELKSIVDNNGNPIFDEIFLESNPSLDKIMQKIILDSLTGDINITTLINHKDLEINNYLQYCTNVSFKLKNVLKKYETFGKDQKQALTDMLSDAEEFKRIYSLSTEMSQIATGWLNLNQGLPTEELEILNQFQKMQSVVKSRENYFKIYKDQMFTNSKDPKIQKKAEKYFEEVINNICEESKLDLDFVKTALINAHKQDLIQNFDIYKYLTDDDYKQNMIDYYDVIKGSINGLHMMEVIPHYKEILNCFKVYVVSKNNLSSKSRFINELLKKNKQNYLSKKQLKKVIDYVDKVNSYNFVKQLKHSIVLNEEIEGFDHMFNKINTDTIDFTTFNGIATFKHWMENEFTNYLRKRYPDNRFVKHLQKISNNSNIIVLAADIDLMNNNSTTFDQVGYDEVIQGMSEFEAISFDYNYKISDLFQIYNIIVNDNKYGSERLTNSFQGCYREDNILNQFFKFLGEQDKNFHIDLDYNYDDFLINIAPEVYPGRENFETAPYIKVIDPVEGYILKEKNGNGYQNKNLIPIQNDNESIENKLIRLRNYKENCPFEMPELNKKYDFLKILEEDFQIIFNEIETLRNDPDKLKQKQNQLNDYKNRIKALLIDYSNQKKLYILKNC